jgi:hypothetical protein
MLCVLVPALNVNSAEWFVAVDGTLQAEGTIDDPWSKEALAPLLSGRSQASLGVVGGDTIYVRGGTYYGHFSVTVTGDSSDRILITPYPGERVIIHGGSGYPTLNMQNNQLVWLRGDYLIFDGFEVTMAMESRWRILDAPNDRYWDGIAIHSSYSIVRNLIVHNIHGPGIAAWSIAVDTDIHTCITFHNGYESVNRTAGHNFYIQNLEGQKNIYNNILFTNFGYGLHVYTENDYVRNINFHHNVVFDCGKIGSVYDSRNIFAGAQVTFDRIYFDNNISYFSESEGENIVMGYWTPDNTNGFIRNNFVVGGDKGIHLRNTIFQVTVTGNKVYVRGPGYPRLLRGSIPAEHDSYTIDNNDYYFKKGWDQLFSGEDWPVWRATYPYFDTNSQYTDGTPTTGNVVVDRYEGGAWVKIVIHNPEGLDRVPVDLLGVLPIGANYYIYAMDQLPTDVTQPIGARYSNDTDAAAQTNPLPDIIHTTSEFGVYILKANTFN